LWNDKRELGDAQPRHVASSANLAAALAGAWGGFSILVDTRTVSLYGALTRRPARVCRGDPLYPTSQCSAVPVANFSR
jgi:hypothetical protein